MIPRNAGRGRLRCATQRGVQPRRRLAMLGLAFTFAVAATVALATPPAAAQLAVHADTMWTMADGPLTNAVVLIDAAGRIESVGRRGDVAVPDGYRTLSAAVVTPGFVDAHSVVGLAGAENRPDDQEQLERSDPIQPALRAIDAYNARETLVDWVRDFGVTTMHTGHGPGALISGQTMIVKTRGDNIDEAVITPLAAVAMTLGPSVTRNFEDESGTRAKGVALLRQKFVDALNYRRQRREGEEGDGPSRDLGLEVLLQVLDREVPAMITAQRTSEILAALRLREEFGFRLVLDGAAESHLVVDEIRRADVPVLLHPTMARQGGALEHASMETAGVLAEAGIPFALQSGFEGYVPKTRVVLFEAATAAAYGLPYRKALASITIDAARIVGVDDRVGSIEVGKDGDLVLFDGDPLEYTTHVCGVVVEGDVVRDRCLLD